MDRAQGKSLSRRDPGSLTRSHVPVLLYKSWNQNRSSVAGSQEAPGTVMVVSPVSRRLWEWVGPLLACAGQGGPGLFGLEPGSSSSGPVLAHEGYDAGRWPCLGEKRVLQELSSSSPLGWVSHQQAVQEAFQRW